MANLYFPGCKVKGDFPAASEKLAAYIQSKRVVTPVGCCRVDHDKLTPADTAVVVCNNCANIIAESGDPGPVSYTHLVLPRATRTGAGPRVSPAPFSCPFIFGNPRKTLGI